MPAPPPMMARPAPMAPPSLRAPSVVMKPPPPLVAASVPTPACARAGPTEANISTKPNAIIINESLAVLLLIEKDPFLGSFKWNIDRRPIVEVSAPAPHGRRRRGDGRRSTGR